MPTSYYGQISAILDEVSRLNPKSILDLGIGFGKYGVLCRELLDISGERYGKETWRVLIDGVEGFADYRNPLHDYAYDHVRYCLIEEALEGPGSVYDLCLMVDVLEHFEKEAGAGVLKKARSRCRALLVSVPAAPGRQTYLGNMLEEHKSVWSLYDFIGYNVLKARTVPMGAGNSSIIVVLQGG